MSTETKYYETVDVKVELPKQEGPVRAIHVNSQATLGLWYKDENSFKNKETGDWEFTHWLRPVNLSDIIREAVGKGFDAGMQREFDNQFGSVPTKSPDKETYLNNL